MIRLIRYLFLLVLALVLVTLAMSNRDLVTLQLLPAEAETYLGMNWRLQVPLFLVIFAGMGLGLLIGFVWEYLREMRFRSTARKATKKAANLERELGRLKAKTQGPKDDVLALLEKPRG
ncbi:LapA family protein [Rhodobacter lacus]|uniref:LapA family protein n=1 Tax=Rhodobacter lacus TaxID=1641972 RepID=A0ABW5A6H0_9RHOB